MSLIKRMLDYFRRKEAIPDINEWNEPAWQTLIQRIKPKGTRTARRREWRESWNEYRRK